MLVPRDLGDIKYTFKVLNYAKLQQKNEEHRLAVWKALVRT
jgi:hypothetical protein